MTRLRRLVGLIAAMTVWTLVTLPSAPRGHTDTTIDSMVVEDYSDVVTANDLGFNDLSGNTGTINKDGRAYGASSLVHGRFGAPELRFEWDFAIDSDQTAFTGVFHSLFGLTRTQATFDGQTVQLVHFPEHSLDLDRLDGVLSEPGGPRSARRLEIAMTYSGVQELELRVELKDVDGGGRFTRFALVGSPDQRALSWDFRNPADYAVIGGHDLDLTKAKDLALVVERRHVGDQVTNPDRGVVQLARIAFELDRPEVIPADDSRLHELLERRSCEHFLDWASRKSRSFGMPQDRSTFGDLLTVGGVGFALPAYAICAERGWITRADAVARTRAVLELLADAQVFGPERIGRLGHRGWLYHFLGVDGRRKLNFDYPETAVDESLNTVELSTIDTGLALIGALAAQSYFDRANGDEARIRELAQQLYDRVDWPFMLERSSQQFYLGWKPREPRDGPPFQFPDNVAEGDYSGTKTDPHTLDFYTDEAFIVTLLAAGSTTHPVANPVQVHCAWSRSGDGRLIHSYPGSLFTYQFLRAFLDTRVLSFESCPGEPATVDWYENSRGAILTAVDHATANPGHLPTYGENAWGISAAEGPDDRYRAYGARPLAHQGNRAPEEDGTVTYYGMVSAVTFGDDLCALARGAVQRAVDRGHWHARFALPDAFHLDTAKPLLGPDQRGPWVNRAGFAIDIGPMLLHLENARSGLVWRLLGSNPNILRALARLGVTSNGTSQVRDGCVAPTPTPMATPTPTPTPTPVCDHVRATIVVSGRSTPVSGTPGADVIVGSAGSDVIDGRDGADRICGGGGNDRLRGGGGRDRLSGEGGVDRLLGGDSHDRLNGGAGDDRIGGGGAGDELNGDGGDDRLRGDRGNDRLAGAEGDDELNGDDGKDLLAGDGGRDRLVGGRGSDRLRGGAGNDLLRGERGNDTLRGHRGNDRLFGHAGNDMLNGGPGRDFCRGGAGADSQNTCER